MKVMEFCQKHNISFKFRKDKDLNAYIFTFEKDGNYLEHAIHFEVFLTSINIDEFLINKVKETFKINE